MISYMEKAFQGSANQKKISTYSFIRLTILLSLIQTFTVECVQRESITATLYWLSAHFDLFLINILLVLIINFFFVAIVGSLRKMFFLSSVILVFLSVANLVKKQFLGEPLLPWDFLRIDQVINLLPKISGQIGWVLSLFVVVLIFILIISKFSIPSYKTNWISRLTFLLIFLVLVPLLVFYRHTPIQTVFQKADIEHIFWMQSENSLTNGFLFGFIMNLEDTMIFEPEGYSRQKIEEIVEKVNNRHSSDVQAGALLENPQVIKPNVVLILSESFWDPVKLPSMTFSQDPIPYFRELSSESITGTMVSPVFGGSTANVEFEILTGLSTSFLPQGSIAYQQYIQQPIPSLAYVLKNNGYDTMAIHPYHDWFYKRDKVYPMLGFDHFLSLGDFESAEIKGDYISDLEVSKRIVQQLSATQDPSFIFAITMQNHGPYPEKRYKENTFTVNGNVSSAGKSMLETYAQGLKDADDALYYLVEKLRESAEPTILIFFGDHLPYLGKDYLVYKETGFIQESENKWSIEEALNMKSAPFLIWSNYQVPEINDQQTISAQYLSLKILDTIQFSDNTLFSFVRNLAPKLPIYNKTLCLDKKHLHIQDKAKDLKDLEEEYNLLVYDTLFGKQYASDLIEPISSRE